MAYTNPTWLVLDAYTAERALRLDEVDPSAQDFRTPESDSGISGWIVFVAAMLFAGVVAFWFRARSKLDRSARDMSAGDESELWSYYSDFSESSLSVDEHTRSVILTSRSLPEARLPYARVTSCEIHINAEPIKHITHQASSLSEDEHNDLLRKLQALRAQSLQSEDERKIDLVTHYKDSPAGVHVLTFYCWVGNRHLTEESLEDSSRAIPEWLQYLDEEVFTPLDSGRGEFRNENARHPDPVSIADELKKIADLKARGVLTEEEFQKAKSRLLD